MRYNAQQRAYSQALRSSEMAEARAAAHERAFLEARGATDRRGLPARRLWQVEDDARGMYCIMVSMFISSSVYFTAPPSACSSRSRLGNVS